MPRVRMLVAALCALLALPAAAQARNLYVSGAGTAAESCLDAASACALDKALTLSLNGDTVIVDGGAGPVVLVDAVAANQAIAIRSTSTTGPKPVVTGAPVAAGAPLINLNAAGASISGLDIRNTEAGATAGAAVYLRGTKTILQDSVVTGEGTPLMSAQSAPIVRRVIVRGGVGGADLSADGADAATIVNSVITTTADDAIGLLNGNEGDLKAVNVTVLAPGAAATGVRANASAVKGVAGSVVTVRNTIVRAGGTDLVAGAAGVCAPLCGDGAVAVDHSDFLTKTGPVTEGAGNLTADPGFVSATDLHLAPTSALRDIGVDDPLSRPVDLDGSPRKDGTGVDLGAYEYLIPLPPLNPLPPAEAATAPKDTTAPTLGVVRLGDDAFRVGPKATALAAAKRRARRTPVGTTVTTGVTERSTILFEIDRILTGRRSAGDCVKVKAKVLRRLKASLKCRLSLPVEPGLERVAPRPGRVSFDFSGRIGTVALPPGPYAMVVIATDAAGNRSAPQRASFTVLPPEKKSKKRSRR